MATVAVARTAATATRIEDLSLGFRICLFQDADQVRLFPGLLLDGKGALEAVHLGPGVLVVKIERKGLLGDDVHMGGVAKRGRLGEGRGQGVEAPARHQHAPDLVHHFHKRVPPLGQVEHPRNVLDEVVGRHKMKVFVRERDGRDGQVRGHDVLGRVAEEVHAVDLGGVEDVVGIVAAAQV